MERNRNEDCYCDETGVCMNCLAAGKVSIDIGNFKLSNETQMDQEEIIVTPIPEWRQMYFVQLQDPYMVIGEFAFPYEAWNAIEANPEWICRDAKVVDLDDLLE